MDSPSTKMRLPNMIRRLFRTRYRIIESEGLYCPQERTWWFPVWVAWSGAWWDYNKDRALRQIEERKKKPEVVYEE